MGPALSIDPRRLGAGPQDPILSSIWGSIWGSILAGTFPLTTAGLHGRA